MPLLTLLAAANASASTSAATNSSAGATGSAGSSAGAAKPATAAAGFNNSELLFNIDVLLLCILGLFFLLLLPRAAIRFTHKREWIDGHFLRSIYLPGQPAARYPARRQDVIAPVAPAYVLDVKGAPAPEPAYSYDDHETSYQHGVWGGATTDESHTYATHADILRKPSTASGRERRRQNVPTYMPGWSTMLPTLASYLRTATGNKLTLGKSIVLLGYFGIILFAGLFMSNPFTTPIRAGFVAASQIPVVVALATKNNLVGLAIGFGYERVSALFISFLPQLSPFRRFVGQCPLREISPQSRSAQFIEYARLSHG